MSVRSDILAKSERADRKGKSIVTPVDHDVTHKRPERTGGPHPANTNTNTALKAPHPYRRSIRMRKVSCTPLILRRFQRTPSLTGRFFGCHQPREQSSSQQPKAVNGYVSKVKNLSEKEISSKFHLPIILAAKKVSPEATPTPRRPERSPKVAPLLTTAALVSQFSSESASPRSSPGAGSSGSLAGLTGRSRRSTT